MDIKLKNNSLLSLGSTINTAITDNCTSIYVNNCPNVSGIAILRQCSSLTRVRLDIGNVSGSFSELMQYSTLAGFNDNYEPQTKPRLVGTWTVNDWYTQEQLAAAQPAFDGLTVVGDSNYLINFDNLAVQVLDSTKPNYNPAVAIILQSNSLGYTLPTIFHTEGRWFITKNDATLTNVSKMFQNVTTVTDANGIVSNDTQLNYSFDKFNEFQYFTNVDNTYRTYGENISFSGATNLEEITLPTTLTLIQTYRNVVSAERDVGGFHNCTSLKNINISHITRLDGTVFEKCSSLQSIIFGNISVINGRCFAACIKLKLTELPSTLTTISGEAFVYAGSSLELSDDDLIDINLPNLTNALGPAFHGCTLIKRVLNLGNITRLQKAMYYNGTFSNCPNLEFIELPSTLTTIDNYSFTTNIPSRTGLKENAIIHLKSVTPPSFGHKDIWPSTVKIYVGDGSSATNDDTILQAYLADTNWSTFSSRLDTWYNYLHPTT